jgi:hypothetical protein
MFEIVVIALLFLVGRSKIINHHGERKTMLLTMSSQFTGLKLVNDDVITS